MHALSGILAAGKSLRILALHNFSRHFDGELVSVLAGCPHLEELYLAPFRVPAEKPMNFVQMWPCLQNLRILVLDLISPSGFVSPVSTFPSHPPRAVETSCAACETSRAGWAIC